MKYIPISRAFWQQDEKINLWPFTAVLILGVFAIFNSVRADPGTILQNQTPHIVFLISEDPNNYEAPRTIPVFAESLRTKHGFKVTVLLGEGERGAFSYPGIEVLAQADLIVVFARRIALPREQLTMIKTFLSKGKPIVGIRTAHHAFSALDKVSPGHEAWPEFPSDILGCENRGYGDAAAGTDVSTAISGKGHPILKRVQPDAWHSKGNVYHVAPLLDENAVVLLTGKVKDKVEPIAWTRLTDDGSRVFYTSLGYPADFETKQYNQLLVNGIHWALNLTEP